MSAAMRNDKGIFAKGRLISSRVEEIFYYTKGDKMIDYENETQEYKNTRYLISLMNPADEELIDLGVAPEVFNKIRKELEMIEEKENDEIR